MAESSRLWTTNGTGDGTATGYTATDWETIFRYCFNGGNESAGGVLIGVGNELAVTGSASPLSLASGAAVVYGHLYVNDAALSLAVTTPLVGTTGGRVVLRVNWAAQTVRAFVVRNTDGIATIPALTQSAGSTWEISLLSFTITTGGVITATAGQEKITYSTSMPLSRLRGATTDAVLYGTSAGAGASAASSGAGLYWRQADLRLDHIGPTLSNTVDTEYLIEQDQVGVTGNVAFFQRFLKRVTAGGGWENIAYIWRLKIDATNKAFMSFYQDKIGVNKEKPAYSLDVVGQVGISPTTPTTPPFVLGANAQNVMVGGLNAELWQGLDLNIIARQGGDADDWSDPGTFDYTPTKLSMVFGSVNWVGLSALSGSQLVSYPVGFVNPPIVFVNVAATSVGALNSVTANVGLISNTQCRIYWASPNAQTQVTFNWVAFGGV